MLPKEYPKYKTDSSFHQRATKNSLWEKMSDLLVQMTRLEAKRNAKPSYCLIDFQSAKTTLASDERGLMVSKKSKTANQHIVTDVVGNLLKVVIGVANIHDTIAGQGVFRSALEKHSSLHGICGDAGRGRFLILFCLWV